MTAPERRYRRLLGLFPREFRDEYGEELTGVLLAEGRPGIGQVADLVRGAVAVRGRLVLREMDTAAWRQAAHVIQIYGAIMLLGLALRWLAANWTFVDGVWTAATVGRVVAFAAVIAGSFLRRRSLAVVGAAVGSAAVIAEAFRYYLDTPATLLNGYWAVVTSATVLVAACCARPLPGRPAAAALLRTASAGTASAGTASRGVMSGGAMSRGTVSSRTVSAEPVSAEPVSAEPVSAGTVSAGTVSRGGVSHGRAFSGVVPRETVPRGTVLVGLAGALVALDGYGLHAGWISLSYRGAGVFSSLQISPYPDVPTIILMGLVLLFLCWALLRLSSGIRRRVVAAAAPIVATVPLVRTGFGDFAEHNLRNPDNIHLLDPLQWSGIVLIPLATFVVIAELTRRRERHRTRHHGTKTPPNQTPPNQASPNQASPNQTAGPARR